MQQSSLAALWHNRAYLATLVAVASAFGTWALLLPVIPTASLDQGASAGLAGAMTGVFMGATVITQMLTPWALRQAGYRPVILSAALLLGLPALAYLAPFGAWWLIICAIRGIGFGALTVAEAALVAELVPPNLLGRAQGILGVVIGVAELIALPTGLAVYHHAGAMVYPLTLPVAILAALACIWLPKIKAAPKLPQTAGTKQTSLLVLLAPGIAMCTIAMGFGAVSSFLPDAIAAAPTIAAIVLSIVGAAQMISRFLAGVIADRIGPGKILIPAGLLGAAGLAGVGMILTINANAWLLLGACFIFGLGFGLVQNDSLLVMFARLPQSHLSQASAFWNISFDAGTGLGSFIGGAVVAASAYPPAFLAVAALAAFGAATNLVERQIISKK